MSDDRDELLHDLAETGRFLGSLTDVGVPAVPARATGPQRENASPHVEAAAAHAGEPPPPEGSPGPMSPGSEGLSPQAGLDAVREHIGDCQRCKLAKGRKNIVFGQGSATAELMFVGEAPGADEDEQGLAFVGRAGRLLTDIVEKGLKMSRSEVWIGNVLKCKPPQNRNPEPDEIIACQPFLEAQIRAIRPKVIVGLGKFGAHWLLKTAEPITRLRGRVGQYEGIPVMPTYHPAYLLRNPSAKKDVWEDMKKVLEMLGRPVPR